MSDTLKPGIWNGGFPGEHHDATLESLHNDGANDGMAPFLTAADRLIQRWRGRKFAGLYLYGTPGTGKTHAAIGLGRALQEEGAEVSYRFGPTLENRYKEICHWSGPPSSPQHGAFPSWENCREPHNPMRVCIYDEYQPAQQETFVAAVEAAAQYGGLIIATSNHADPFELVRPADVTAGTTQDALLEASLAQVDPEKAQALQAKRAAAAEAISASLRSRVASGFLTIEFTGPDQREQNGFWA